MTPKRQKACALNEKTIDVYKLDTLKLEIRKDMIQTTVALTGKKCFLTSCDTFCMLIITDF